MRKVKIICSLLVLFLVIGVVGCGLQKEEKPTYTYDEQSLEAAESFAAGNGAGNGGVNFRGSNIISFERSASDIFEIKKSFLLEYNAETSGFIDENLEDWYVYLRSNIESIGLYVVHNMKYFETFQDIYGSLDVDKLKRLDKLSGNSYRWRN